MSSTEILSLVEQYKEAQQLIEAAQAEMDDLKRQITEERTRKPPRRNWPPASPRPPRAAASPSPERMVCNGTT